MALAFLRHDAISAMSSPAEAKAAAVQPRVRKFSKKKFSVLLGGNLIVWLIFIVSLLDIHVFSMNAMDAVEAIPLAIPQRLAVSGIVYSETSPSAIISNQVYGVGDSVDGYVIRRITRNQVEFEKDGQTTIRQVR